MRSTTRGWILPSILFYFLPPLMEGLPGVKASLLEEYGIRLVTYDLPGFGESDPHPNRNLNSSAMDVLHLVNAVNVTDKFWMKEKSAEQQVKI